MLKEAMRCGLRSLFLVMLVGLSLACSEDLLHDLSEAEANQVRVLLSEAGIPAEKVSDVGGAWKVSVSSDNAVKALAALRDFRALRDRELGSSETSSSLIQSREERAHYVERSISKSLEQTFERLPDVLEARVHLNLREGSRFEFLADPSTQSASVLLVVTRAFTVDESDIRTLVSGASGIAKDSVSFLSVLSNSSPGPSEELEMPPEPAQESSKLEPLGHYIIQPISLFLVGGVLCVGLITPVIWRVRKGENDFRNRTRAKNSIAPSATEVAA